MKTLTMNTTIITNAVALANTFTQKDGEYAGAIVISGNDSKLEVKGSNFENTVVLKNIDFISSDLTDDSFADFAVNGKKLLTVLKAARTDDVQFEIENEHIVVKSGRSKVKIDTFANTQEISIDNQNAKVLTGLEDYIDDMGCILHTIDQNPARYELGGVLLQSQNGILNIVGTDTKRLASVTVQSDINDVDIIIPRKAVEFISKHFSMMNPKIEIDENTLYVHTDNLSYATKLVNAKYPHWQRIIPQTFEQKITINRERLADMIKDASIFNQEIVIEFKNNQISVFDFDGEAEATEDFESNANITFGINAKSMLEFLASFEHENVQICFNSNATPVMFVATTNYKEIMMPIVIPENEEAQEAA